MKLKKSEHILSDSRVYITETTRLGTILLLPEENDYMLLSAIYILHRHKNFYMKFA